MLALVTCACGDAAVAARLGGRVPRAQVPQNRRVNPTKTLVPFQKKPRRNGTTGPMGLRGSGESHRAGGMLPMTMPSGTGDPGTPAPAPLDLPLPPNQTKFTAQVPRRTTLTCPHRVGRGTTEMVYFASQYARGQKCLCWTLGHMNQRKSPGIPSHQHHWVAGIPAPRRKHGDERDCLCAHVRTSPPLGRAYGMQAVPSPADLSR